MRHYETVFIVNPDLSEEENAQIASSYQEILVDGGATMLKVDDWGRRRMAYEIKKFSKGYYTLYEYASELPEAIAEMERKMRIDDNIIRFMTIKGDEEFDLEARQAADAEKAARLEAEAEAAAEAKAAEDDDDDEDGPRADDDYDESDEDDDDGDDDEDEEK